MIKKLANCVNANGDPFTRDMSATVAKGFTKCSVENFRHEASQICNKCNLNPDAMKWGDITTKLLRLYRSLSGQKGEWPPGELPGKKVEQMQLATFAEEMKQLKSKIANCNLLHPLLTTQMSNVMIAESRVSKRDTKTVLAKLKNPENDIQMQNFHPIPKMESLRKLNTKAPNGFTVKNVVEAVDGGIRKSPTRPTRQQTIVLVVLQAFA